MVLSVNLEPRFSVPDFCLWNGHLRFEAMFYFYVQRFFPGLLAPIFEHFTVYRKTCTYTMSELSIEHCGEDLGAMLNNHVFPVWHCWISVYPCSFPTRESLLKSSWVQSSSLVHQIVTALMNIDWTSVMMHHHEVILAKQQHDFSYNTKQDLSRTSRYLDKSSPEIVRYHICK